MMNAPLCPSLQRWERARTKTLSGRLRTCLLSLLLFGAQNRLSDTRVLVHTFGWAVMILNIYFTYCGQSIIIDASKNSVVKKNLSRSFNFWYLWTAERKQKQQNKRGDCGGRWLCLEQLTSSVGSHSEDEVWTLQFVSGFQMLGHFGVPVQMHYPNEEYQELQL